MNDIKKNQFKIEIIKNDTPNMEVQKYEIVNFSEKDFQNKKLKKEIQNAENSDFNINDVVKKYRGHIKQQKEEKHQSIEEEIERRVEKLKIEKEKEAYDKGLAIGTKIALDEMEVILKSEVDKFIEYFNEIKNERDRFLKEKRDGIFNFIKMLTKWISLKELENNGDYVHLMLDKIVNDIESRDDLLIKINKKYIKDIPRVLDILEKKSGEFPNIRIEEYDVEEYSELPNLVVESRNELVDASIKTQFETFESIFNTI